MNKTEACGFQIQLIYKNTKHTVAFEPLKGLRVGAATYTELLHRHSPWCCDPQALLQVPQISTIT